MDWLKATVEERIVFAIAELTDRQRCRYPTWREIADKAELSWTTTLAATSRMRKAGLVLPCMAGTKMRVDDVDIATTVSGETELRIGESQNFRTPTVFSLTRDGHNLYLELLPFRGLLPSREQDHAIESTGDGGLQL